jgi:putative tryptophan/tyrosine transport system substrate-binding protein
MAPTTNFQSTDQERGVKMITSRLRNRRIFGFSFILGVFSLILLNHTAEAKTYRIGVLLSDDIRVETFLGLKDGLKKLGYTEGKEVIFEVNNAKADNAKLPVLAREIIAGKPDVAIAGGGVEADALREASQGTGVPVVFLAVSSAVERGLVKSMTNPGGNMTGIDTNDAQLTAKRLMYLKKMLPKAKRILILNIPTLVPSAKAVEVARKVAPDLGFEIEVIEGKTKEEIAKAATAISPDNVDVIYIGMAHPVWQMEKGVFFPISESKKIPILGITRENLANGSFASYACSRHAAGSQAARLVKKIFDGVPPENIPVETPEQLELVINKWVVERLGMELPEKAWKLADEIVNMPVN